MAHRPASGRVREGLEWIAFLLVCAVVLVALCAVPPEAYVR